MLSRQRLYHFSHSTSPALWCQGWLWTAWVCLLSS
jgi:hypothetical protein